MADALIGAPVIRTGLVLGILAADRREKQQLEAAAKLIDDALADNRPAPRSWSRSEPNLRDWPDSPSS